MGSSRASDMPKACKVEVGFARPRWRSKSTDFTKKKHERKAMLALLSFPSIAFHTTRSRTLGCAILLVVLGVLASFFSHRTQKIIVTLLSYVSRA